MDKIVLLKFINGEEVIGEVVAEDPRITALDKDAEIQLRNAYCIAVLPNPQNETQGVLHFYEVSQFTNAKILTFNKESIMMQTVPNEQLLSKYTQKVTGIVIASPSALLKG